MFTDYVEIQTEIHVNLGPFSIYTYKVYLIYNRIRRVNNKIH